MLNRRIPLHGLLAVLFALAAQLGMAAAVPRLDPLAGLIGAEVPCHAANGTDTPGPAPMHPLDCLFCPLCLTLHVPPTALVIESAVVAPSLLVVALRPELPPPSTAPPARPRPYVQQRAPPIDS